MFPDRIYVGASGIAFAPVLGSGGATSGGVFKSSDGGAIWDSASSGLSTFDVRTIAMVPDASAIYAGGFGGTSKSTDDGASWNPTGLTAYTGSLVIDGVNRDVLYAITGRANGCNSSESLLLSSSDGGANWNGTVSPLNSGCIINAAFTTANRTPIVIDPSNPNTLYLGESDNQDGYSALLKSIDRGRNWRATWDWFNGLRGSVRAIAVEPAHAGTVYAGIDDGISVFGSVMVLPDSSGLFKSTDSGATWSRTGLTRSAVSLIAIDPSNSEIVYAAVEGHYSQPKGFQGLFKSTDRGGTWTAMNNGLERLIGTRLLSATALVIDRSNPQVLYLGTSTGGVFQSLDAGATWRALNQGLTSLQIRELVVGGAHRLYAATGGGVFSYSDD